MSFIIFREKERKRIVDVFHRRTVFVPCPFFFSWKVILSVLNTSGKRAIPSICSKVSLYAESLVPLAAQI